jgi:hypothetical protein
MDRIAPLMLLLLLGSCANQDMTAAWEPTPSATLPLDQARRECHFLTAKAPTNADQPHNLSSAQLADESGALLGLSPEGIELFKRIELFKQCMASKGYLAGPRLSDDGGT